MPVIEQNGQHPVNVFAKPMSYEKTVNGEFEKSDGSGAHETKGVQLVPYAFRKKAIIDIYNDMPFQKTAVTREQPLHSGKSMKMYRYFPMIDDRNVNDQGIDADGVVIQDGNLWGSSRDPGVIKQKMPWGREGGGRINRVGFSRKEIKSDLKKVQFFWEYTEDDMLFDSDAELYKHITMLSAEAANTIVENLIQLDLKDNAEVKLFAGGKTQIADIDDTCLPTMDLFSKLNEAANFNRVPMTTRIISGSRNIDTRVVPNARVLYVPDELTTDLEKVKDYFGNQAFVGVEHYAAAGRVMNNEIGKIGKFRIISVLNMQYAGVSNQDGQTTRTDANGKVIVYPMIMVGSDSYNAVTLFGGGKSLGSKFKWRVISKKPGRETADSHDPYGENGFYSTRLYYGCIALRPERLAVVYTACSK